MPPSCTASSAVHRVCCKWSWDADGQLLLLEHSRSPNAALGWYQDVTEKPVKSMGKGCSWNQRMPLMVRNSGLRLQDIQYDLLGTVVSITATKSL